jgi:hypothetical protein
MDDQKIEGAEMGDEETVAPVAPETEAAPEGDEPVAHPHVEEEKEEGASA